MDEKELKQYYDILTAAWRFFKKHINMDGSTEAYRLMMEDGKRQASEFTTDGQLAHDLFVAMCSAVQRYDLGRRGKLDRNKG